jgi:drug/metabolite transporter (DMT)-like permease
MPDDFTPVLLGLASAFSWGSGDFIGGLASRRSSILATVIVSQAVGLTMLALMGLVTGEKAPYTLYLLWSAAAGLSGGMGLVALYRALAKGEMTVVAPVTGVVTAGIPVLFGAYLEGFPTWLQLIGFMMAITGVGLTTGFRRTSQGLLAGLIAGIGFGLFLVFMGQVGDGYFFWPLTISRSTTMAACLTLALARKTTLKTSPKILPMIALGGLLDAGGSGLFLLARHATRLDVSAVLSSLYPMATVILAYLILGEKPTPLKTAGILLAIAATPLIKNTT